MLKAVGKLDCSTVEVESDPYIPLTVTWGTGSGQQPLYWRISGNSGGELEFKIDPQRGALLELIVIDAPPSHTAESTPAPLSPRIESGVPIFDCSPWGILTNPDYSEFTSRVVTSIEDVAFSTDQGIAHLTFPSKQEKKILACENTQVHLTDEGYLAAVTVRFSP